MLLPLPLIRTPVPLERRHVRAMTRLVRALFQLSRKPAYRELVKPQVPSLAAIDPGHDAVMMGYDFHLGPEGPRLIEVNTNAGGGLFAYLSHFPANADEEPRLAPRLQTQILNSFAHEFFRHSGGLNPRPRSIAIVDEAPTEQFLYPEMRAFQKIFEDWGVAAVIVDPQQLEEREEGLFHEGQKIDLIYNRHCDFYLETQPLAAIAGAYAARRVCLTPNPFAYALLGDKRRMTWWSAEEVLRGLGLAPRMMATILGGVPYSRLLIDMGMETAWQQRKSLVFKPVTRFGSRGVYMGASISRTRFESLPPDQTLAQALVPPSLTQAQEQTRALKTDFRLFAYRDRILGITARLYRGQVTNMQSEGSGFAPVRIVP